MKKLYCINAIEVGCVLAATAVAASFSLHARTL